MTGPADRLERADRALNVVALALIVLPGLVYLARRRIAQAVSELPTGALLDQANAEIDRLRTQLDGALEALHEAQGESQGSSKADQGAEPGKALDIPGSVEGEPGS